MLLGFALHIQMLGLALQTKQCEGQQPQQQQQQQQQHQQHQKASPGMALGRSLHICMAATCAL